MKLPAIIVDLDGTLVNNEHRIPLWDKYKREDKVEEYNKQIAFDSPHLWCQELIRAFANLNYKIIFLTARTDVGSCKRFTEEWLLRNVGPGVDYMLIMREEKDYSPAWQMKHNMYLQYINPIYDVVLAVDDTYSVTTMWRDLGIPCLQCGDRQ